MDDSPTIDNFVLKTSRLIGLTPFYYGWIILAVGVVGLIVSSSGQTFVISVFLDSFIADLGISRANISLIYGLATLSASLVLPRVGQLLDRYGPRTMVLWVAFSLGLACVVASQARGVATIFVGFIILRLFGLGSLNMVSNNVIAQWFMRKRGLAMGLAGGGASLGMAFFPPLAEGLINIVGWRGAWVALGLLTWSVMLPVGWFLFKDRPEDYGLLPDGDTTPGRGQPGGSAVGLLTTDAAEENWTLAEARRTAAFWLFLGAGFVFSVLFSGVVFHQFSIFAQGGVERAASIRAFQLNAIVSGGTIFLAGWLLDRTSARAVLATACLLQSAAMAILIFLSQPWHALLYGAIFGMGGGSYLAVDKVIWPKYFGRRHLGAINGVSLMGVVTGGALGAYPLGLSFDYLGSYVPALVGLMILPLCLAGAAFFVKRPSKATN